jgi:predicted secreted protein
MKKMKWLLILAMALAFLVFAGCNGGGNNQNASTSNAQTVAGESHERWEYTWLFVETFNNGYRTFSNNDWSGWIDGAINEINRMGGEGWELVSTSRYHFDGIRDHFDYLYFKRRLP